MLLAGMLLKGYWGRFGRRTERAGLGKKSDGGETESWVGGNKIRQKEKCFGDLQSVKT